MHRIRRRTLVGLLPLALALASAGCVHVHRHPGHGPPPHAPAHGYRAKHDGHALVFDAGLGVYVVVGLPGVYFDDGRYLRRMGTGWQSAAAVEGPWHAVGASTLPPGLRGKGGPPGHVKKHGNGKAGGPW